MAYIHKGTKSEHSDTPATIEDRCTFNYCSICNNWFYRMDKDGLERLLGEPVQGECSGWQAATR